MQRYDADVFVWRRCRGLHLERGLARHPGFRARRNCLHRLPPFRVGPEPARVEELNACERQSTEMESKGCPDGGASNGTRKYSQTSLEESTVRRRKPGSSSL